MTARPPSNHLLELGVGFFVALGLAALFVLAFKVSNLASFSNDGTYEISARFNNIGSLTVRAPVSVSGVTVGRVSGIEFDNQTFQAVVRMAIDRRYAEFPLDTSAQILTAGLLGEQYVALEPGGDIEVLKDGDQLQITQSALVLENLIGQFLYNKAADGGE